MSLKRRGKVWKRAAHTSSSVRLLRSSRNESDLKDARPQFASNKEALSICIVSYSIYHGSRFKAIGRAHKELEINPADHSTALRRDARNSIGLPHIGKNLTINEFKFVQLVDRNQFIVN